MATITEDVTLLSSGEEENLQHFHYPLKMMRQKYEFYTKNPQQQPDSTHTASGNNTANMNPEQILLNRRRRQQQQQQTDWGVSEYYCNILNNNTNNQKILQSIPILTKKGIEQGIYKSGSLVRYRGMIQDVFDPEYYVGMTNGIHKQTMKEQLLPTKYMDVLSLPSEYEMSETNNDYRNISNTMSRLPLFVIPTPGESKWVQEQYDDNISSTSTAKQTTTIVGTTGTPSSAKKRSLQQTTSSSTMMMMDLESNNNNNNNNNTSLLKKNKVIQQVPTATTTTTNNKMDEDTNTNDTKKKEEDHAVKEKTTLEYDEIFPLPLNQEEMNTAVPCLVKIYDCDGGNATSAFKVNTLMEFIGVYSVDPVINHLGTSSSSLVEEGGNTMVNMELKEELDFENEIKARNPPSSIVPRLHCICYKPLTCNQYTLYDQSTFNVDEQSKYTSIPLRNSSKDEKSNKDEKKQEEDLNTKVKKSKNSLGFEKMTVLNNNNTNIQTIRGTIINLLTIALGGDAFVAEYVLLHILSMIRGREPGLTIGTFSLNIMRMTNYHYLNQVLKLLLPRVAYVPLGIEDLNKKRFVPRKNYEMNRLITGPLQVLDHTYIICDETKMNAGKLNDTGCRNLQALQQLSNEGVVKYDFQYHEMEFNVDTPLLILSNHKSMVKTTYNIPLNQLYPINKENVEVKLNDELKKIPSVLLTKCRDFLLNGRYSGFTIPKTLGPMIETHFVNERKLKPKEVTGLSMHLWLSHARLLSISHGEMVLNEEMWEKSTEMDRKRTKRFDDFSKTQNATMTN